jgi:hypothetical protein
MAYSVNSPFSVSICLFILWTSSVSVFLSSFLTPFLPAPSTTSVNLPIPSTNAQIPPLMILNSFAIASTYSINPSDNSIIGAAEFSSLPSKTNLCLPSFFSILHLIPTRVHPAFHCAQRWQPGPRAFQRKASSACAHLSQGGVNQLPTGFDFICFFC